MAAHRKPARKSTPPEARARRQRRKQPRPCKRCAASVRRRSCRSSWSATFEIFVALCMAEFAPANRTPILRHSNGVEEFEKPRLVSQRLIRRGPNQGCDIVTGRFLFEEDRIKGHLLLTDKNRHGRQRHAARRPEFFQCLAKIQGRYRGILETG